MKEGYGDKIRGKKKEGKKMEGERRRGGGGEGKINESGRNVYAYARVKTRWKLKIDTGKRYMCSAI